MCVEWGSVAEWATVVVAIAAAAAAFWALRYNKAAASHARDAAEAAAASNELTAQAYRDDVRVRDEAQARLVYATLSAGHPVILGGTEVPKPWTHGAAFVPLQGMVCEHESGVPYVGEDARTVVVCVQNRSDEIISSIRVTLFDDSEKIELSAAPGWIVLLPDESVTFEFLVPFGDTRYLPDIAFRDSTGKYWFRRGYDPICRLSNERRNEFGLPKAP